MKKLAVLCMIFCLLLGCACAEDVSYDPLHFSLWADTASGYEWTCEYDDNGVLAKPMEEAIEQSVGSNYEYYFGVAKPGDAEIIFNYGMTWDLSAPVKTIICSVTANDDGTVIVRKAETYADDRMIEIILPCNPTTGWTWSYQGESENTGMVTLLSETYEADNPHLEGAGGNMTYQLQVDKSGETVLLFNHANVWDPTAAAQESYAVVVYANEDMDISISVER